MLRLIDWLLLYSANLSYPTCPVPSHPVSSFLEKAAKVDKQWTSLSVLKLPFHLVPNFVLLFVWHIMARKETEKNKGKRQNRLPKTQRSGVMWFWWREYNKRGLKGSGYNWQRTVYCHWRTRTFIFEANVSPHYKSPRCSASFEVFQHVPRCSVPWCPVPKCLRCLMSSRMLRNIAFIIQCVQRVQGVLKCFEVYHGVPFQARFGCLSVSQLLG